MELLLDRFCPAKRNQMTTSPHTMRRQIDRFKYDEVARLESKWQAKGLFQNFFPAADGESDTDSITLEMPSPPSPAPAPGTPSSTLSSLFSETFAGLSSASSSAASPSTPSTSRRGSVAQTPSKNLDESAEAEKRAMEEHLAACAAARKPLSAAQLERLACVFAENIPDEEFSVAALQGCECCFRSPRGSDDAFLSLPYPLHYERADGRRCSVGSG